jgi:phenylacetate-CoA ligase
MEALLLEKNTRTTLVLSGNSRLFSRWNNYLLHDGDFLRHLSRRNGELNPGPRRLSRLARHAAPVRETYGMAEIVAAASECRQGKLHLWPEVGWVGGKAAPPSAAGDLVCTSLLNPDMPLVRYRIGDRASMAACGPVFGCRRSLPLVVSIEGRANELLLTRDGCAVCWLNSVFCGSGAGFIERTLEQPEVLYLPAPGFRADAADLIVKRVQAQMGPVSITLQPVASVPRQANGKFRAVVCDLPIEDRWAATRQPVET